MVTAVRSRGQHNAAEHREDGEHHGEVGTLDTARRRQLFSIVGRRRPGRLIS
jgi:hypothetical protein